MKALERELMRRGAQLEYDELRGRMGKLEMLLGMGPRPGRPAGVKRKKRKMSAAARAAISKAQKARWAKQKSAK